MKPRILVTRKVPESVEARIGALFNAELNPDDTLMSAETLLAKLQGCDGALVSPTERFPAAMIDALPASCRILASFSVGVDHIDVAAAARRGLTVANTPDVLTDATADIAMLLILGAMRAAWSAQVSLRAGEWGHWAPTGYLGKDLKGATLGIVGMGRIGQATARRALAFGMKVSYWNRRAVDLPADLAALPWERDLDALFGACDVISLHTPATAETENMVDRRRIGLMPQGAVLVNTARGSLVDDDALIDALAAGRLFAAGLDVFRGEPAFDPRYKTLSNAYLLPHIGSATHETRAAMGHKAVDNLEAFFKTGIIPDRVC
jgi:glyoxylate reductase